MEQKWLQTKIEFPEPANKVTLLFGRICSGKSSYRSDELIPRVVVSTLVRSVIADLAATRDQLQDTMHLDNLIADHIIKMVDIYEASYGRGAIVDGIRQVSIVEMILEKYPDAELIWLEVPEEERRSRYESRGDAKDVQPFDIADNKDIELECQKIFSTFKDKLKIINNYGIN
jgi:hypothetical protein